VRSVGAVNPVGYLHATRRIPLCSQTQTQSEL